MLDLIVWGLLWAGSYASILSPLTHLQPDIEFAKHWSGQAKWQAKHLTQNATAILRSVPEFLISDAKSQLRISGDSVECVETLIQFAHDSAAGKEYALRAGDSDGKPESGVYLGNMRWNGRYHECMRVRNQYFEGKWCSIELGPRLQIFKMGASLGALVGICVPKTCSEEYLTKNLKPIAVKLGTHIQAICPVQPTEWTAADVASLTVFIMFVALVAIGTALDLVVTTNQNDEYDSVVGAMGNGLYFNAPKVIPLKIKVLIAFSVVKNTKSLLDTEPRPYTIDALYGIRFITIAWVVLGYAYIIPLLFIKNPAEFEEWATGHASFQLVQNASYSIDTLFFINGLIATYVTLKKADREGRLVAWKMYVVRYLRLTPAYAAIIFFIVGFYEKLGDGPMWAETVAGASSACRTKWWTNLLYINNLYPTRVMSECFVVGWYLANEMQFFLLAPISLLLLRRRPKFGVSLLLSGTFSSVFVTGILSSLFNELPQSVKFAQIMRKLSGNSSSYLDDGSYMSPVLQADSFWSDLYAKPWCRISVYLMGMMTGHFLYVKKREIKIYKPFAAIRWLLSAGLSSAIIFGLWPYISTDQQMPVHLAAFYNAMARVVWACALSWVVVACATGNGGPVNTFLSWKLFVPLSRLAYCIYLVHTLVLLWFYATSEELVNFSNKVFAFNYVGSLVISTFAAYVLSMLFEAPFIRLSELLFPERSRPAHDCSLMVEEENGDEEVYNNGLDTSNSEDLAIREIDEILLSE